MKITEIYYGLWSGMADWTVTKRAVFVIGFIALFLYIFCMPLLMKVFSLLLKGVNALVKYLYCAIAFCVEMVMRNKTLISRAETLNKISERMESWSEKISQKAEKVSKKKRISFLSLISLYGLLIFLIALPGIAGKHINENYMPFFSLINEKYQSLESGTLEIAKGYPPLFEKGEEDVLNEIEDNSKNQEETLEEIKEEIKEEEIWLSLSEKGKNGSNVRKKPSKDSPVITAISGDEKVVYLKRKDGWVQVRLKTDEKGWIKESLLEGVPEKE